MAEKGKTKKGDRKVTAGLQPMRRVVMLTIVLIIGGCSNSSTDPVTEEHQADQPGFTARVSGIVNGEISGDGIVTYLPPKQRDLVIGMRPGYFLVTNLNSDKAEERAFNILFRIPDKAQPGNYKLMAPDPLKVGEDFDVQFETVEEGRSILYQTNTQGTMTLENFFPERADAETRNITGAFQFVTENNEGGQISARGTFDLHLVGQVVFQDSNKRPEGSIEGLRAELN